MKINIDTTAITILDSTQVVTVLNNLDSIILEIISVEKVVVKHNCNYNVSWKSDYRTDNGDVVNIYIDANNGNVIKSDTIVLSGLNPAPTIYGTKDINDTQCDSDYCLTSYAGSRKIQTKDFWNDSGRSTPYRNDWNLVSEIKRDGTTSSWPNALNYNYFYGGGWQIIANMKEAYSAHWSTQHAMEYWDDLGHSPNHWIAVGVRSNSIPQWDGYFIQTTSDYLDCAELAHEYGHGMDYQNGRMSRGGLEARGLSESFCDISGIIIAKGKNCDEGWEVFDRFLNHSFNSYYPVNSNKPHDIGKVANHWFYKLQQRTGNLQEAADIAIPMFLGLSGASTYLDARMSSIAITELIYGECSDMDEFVTNEWYRRGVGDRHEVCLRITTPMDDAPYICDYDVENNWGYPWCFYVSDGPYGAYWEPWSIPYNWDYYSSGPGEICVEDFGPVPPSGQTWYLVATSNNTNNPVSSLVEWSIVDCGATNPDPCEDILDNFSLEKNIDIDPSEQVLSTDIKNHIIIYPNPVNDDVLFVSNKYEGHDLRIFDLSGKLLVKCLKTENQINISTLEPGLYIVMISLPNQQNSDILVNKLIVTR